MSSYITVTFGTSSPSSATATTNNCAVVGRDSLYSGTSDVLTLTSLTDAIDYGIDADSDLYQTLSSFYSQNGVGQTVVYAVPYPGSIVGASYTLVQATGEDDVWYAPGRPVEDITAVAVDFDDGSGQISQTVTTHYAKEALGSYYSGKITFTAAGPIDGGGVCYSGEVPSTAKVYMSYSKTAFQAAMALLMEDDYDIQFVTLSYDVANQLSYTDGAATGLMDDFRTIKEHCAAAVNDNKWRMGVISLPSDATPNSSAAAYGGSANWEDIRTDVGQSRNVIAIKAIPTETGGSANDDPAGVYMGLIAATHPHKNITLQPLTISQTSYENKMYQMAWESAQVAVPRYEPLDPDRATVVNFGMTFGTGRENRINNVRCKYLVARMLYTDLYLFLRAGDVNYNIAGLDRIEGQVRATLQKAKGLGYIDSIEDITILGKELFTVPYSSLTTTQKALYASYTNSQRVTISVTYGWSPGVETIVLNPVLEV